MHASQQLFVGMDIHKETHAVWAGNCYGEAFLAQQIANEATAFQTLVAEIAHIAQRQQLSPLFGLEDTSGNGAGIATFLLTRGYPVKTVPPILVHRLNKKRPMPEKSDLVDAKGVAKVLIHEGSDTLPDYKITQDSLLAKDLRDLVNDREALIAEQTRLKNQLHSLLHRSYGLGYRQVFKNVFSGKALQHWQAHPCPQPEESILAKQIQRKAARLVGIGREAKVIEQDLKEVLEQSQSTILTLPGCGVVTAAALLAEVKDINRFHSPAALAKYAGVSPRQNSSGKSQHYQKTKAGNRRLNYALQRVALASIGRYGAAPAKQYYERKVSEGKSKMRALTCLKRRLVEIIYVLLKQKVAYDANKTA